MHSYRKGDTVLIANDDSIGNMTGWEQAVITRVGSQSIRYSWLLPSGEPNGQVAGAMLHEAIPSMTKPIQDDSE